MNLRQVIKWVVVILVSIVFTGAMSQIKLYYIPVYLLLLAGGYLAVRRLASIIRDDSVPADE